MKPKVFISYSHNDSEWLDRIKPFLKGLEQKANFDFWSDKQMEPGDQWNGEINKALYEADAAILLVSQDFLVSEYVNEIELPTILKAIRENGLRIFPVIISSHFITESPISKFQQVNGTPLDQLNKAEQNIILSKLVESIYKLVSIKLEGLRDGWLEKFREQFVFAEGARFVLGDNELYGKMHGLKEEEVIVNSFFISKYVITQSEWRSLMRSQPWLDKENVTYGDNLPAVYISWHDTSDLIKTLNKKDSKFYYRLPTEMEWEFAARGGIYTAQMRNKFCFGNETSLLNNYGWFDQNASLRGKNYAQPIGLCEPNQLGLYDMHGNIWEWLNDDIDGLRPLRGGGFNFHAEGAASAFRVLHKPEVKGEATGFRLVRILREPI